MRTIRERKLILNCSGGVSKMPRGPQGQKRPADAIARAVMVAQIATGEIEDDGYESNHPRGSAGGAARSASLSSKER